MATSAELVRSWYEALARGDVPAVLGLLAPDIAWTEAAGFPLAGTYQGPEAVRDGVLARLGSEWDSFRAVPAEIIDGGETIVVLGRYSGTYKETGKAMEADFAHVWTVRNGQAVRFRQYVDSALVQEALQP